ncbi:hypothetical protein QR685DRAFT_550851 [Neurospora intermedia]|uniref:Uncharacterized protein n=1 Tax=Neurospora intermedia TaxID=5142 RepID=A0ABR3DJR4_NEUIN
MPESSRYEGSKKTDTSEEHQVPTLNATHDRISTVTRLQMHHSSANPPQPGSTDQTVRKRTIPEQTILERAVTEKSIHERSISNERATDT